MESYLKLLSPKETKKSKYYKKIMNSKPSVLGPAAYHLDWTFIFQQIDLWKKNNNNKIATILDVGCGNSTFHRFLEQFYRHGIIGIDREDSTKGDFIKFEKLGHTMVNAIDLSIDFIDDGQKYFQNKADIVFWNSAIEHNNIPKIKRAIKVSLNCLKPGGIFVSTWAFGESTFWHKDAIATILSSNDAEKVFKCKWLEKPNFEKIKNEYLDNYFGLRKWHQKRFGDTNIKYLHSGNVIIKN